MNRVDSIFASLRAAGRAALMPYLCAGHPTDATTRAALLALERAGANIIELGFPFSDPIADGPVIAAAMHEALAGGTTPQSVLECVRAARRDGLGVGMIGMVSVSILQRAGALRLLRDAADAGFDGFIFPDAPLEESSGLISGARDAGLTVSLLVSPTTPPQRMEQIAKACTGFVYLLARVGITGESQAGPAADLEIDVAAIAQRVALLRTMTDLPIACGFGIATPEHVRAVVRPPAPGGAAGGGTGADAAIVGSALVKRMTKAAASGGDPVEEAQSFVRALAAGLSA